MPMFLHTQQLSTVQLSLWEFHFPEIVTAGIVGSWTLFFVYYELLTTSGAISDNQNFPGGNADAP